MSERVSLSPHRSLAGAVLAAIGASACCVGPLALLGLGFGGAWISTLTALEPYRPVFVGMALVFLFLAFRRLYLMPAACVPGEACAEPGSRRRQRVLFWVVTVLLLALIAFPYYGAFFFS